MPTPREVYTLADLRDWPAATAGGEWPLRLAVLGDPVAHSASPPMQNAALAAAGIGVRYTRLHVRPDELPEALRLLGPAGFLGANLTIPHKVAALALLDAVDSHAAGLGAVNTVRVEADGFLRGFNTDGPGFARAVQAEFALGLRGARVLIFGAGGGAGRALAMQCAAEGCARLVLVNRTAERACSLARALATRTDAAAVAWEASALEEALRETDLVVNTSALGLRADDPSPVPAALLSTRLRVFDTVYRADGGLTPLLAAAREARAPAAGGRSLLLYQGALAFEHWFGQPAPLDAMRAALGTAGGYQ